MYTLDQYSKCNDSDITFRIFIADVSEDINSSGHDSYFSLFGPCHDKKNTIKCFCFAN